MHLTWFRHQLICKSLWAILSGIDKFKVHSGETFANMDILNLKILHLIQRRAGQPSSTAVPKRLYKTPTARIVGQNLRSILSEILDRGKPHIKRHADNIGHLQRAVILYSIFR